MKPRHVHVSIKLDTSNGHSRATRRQAAVIGGLLSRKCRCQAFMPIEAEFEKLMTESRKIKRKTKPNVKSEHIMKVSLTSYHILYLGWLMWYNVCKSCVFTVTCLSKQSRNRYLICLYNHDLTIAAPNNLFLLKLLFQVIKKLESFEQTLYHMNRPYLTWDTVICHISTPLSCISERNWAPGTAW